MLGTLKMNEQYRLKSSKPLNQSLFYAALLWPVLHERARKQLATAGKGKKYSRGEVLEQTAEKLLRDIAPHIVIPGDYRRQLLNIWLLQPLLESRHASSQNHPNFLLGMRLLKFRASVHSELRETASWWNGRRRCSSPERTD